MHPHDCPKNWEYEKHPDHDTLIRSRTAALLKALRRGAHAFPDSCTNTRPTHQELFDSLTPVGLPYFAGAYRGENHRCLRWYSVKTPIDRRVGARPEHVVASMVQLAVEIERAVSRFNFYRVSTTHSRGEVLKRLVPIVCNIFQVFLTIHPYANGNGHVSRFLAWSVLIYYGHIPRRWPIHPGFKTKSYSDLISKHRSGDVVPLERFVHYSISGRLVPAP